MNGNLPIPRLNPDQHRERHILLHNHLDELAADFLRHTGRLLSETTVMEFMEWSHGQTQNPTEEKS